MPSDFEQLICEHGARIRRIATRYADRDSVEDLVQDILIRLWRSHPSFRSDAKVETWIYRVALNACMTYLKGSIRERKRRAVVAQTSSYDSAAPAGSATMSDVLTGFLAQLGEIDASVLMMYLDGLSAEDMSGVLGVSANAISVRINRLKQKFSALYVD